MSSKLLAIALGIITIYAGKTLKAQGVTIGNGANIVVSGAGNIVVNNGNFSNSGTFSAGTGTVAFTGTSVSGISGTSATSFYNFLMNKAGSAVSLNRTIGVTNTLTMGGGNINLNGFDLDMGNTGSIAGEQPASRVLGSNGGFLIRSQVLNTPNRVNPGNIGVEITTASSPGLTTIKRGHRQIQLDSVFGMQRFFEINAANNVNDNATLRFYYFDEELGGINESELTIYSVSPATPGGSPEQVSRTDAVNNYVEITNAPLMGQMIPASKITDPARASYFTVVAVNSRALLSWGTQYEINTDHFELERSVDGGNFQRFANVTAAGTTTISNDYTYTDPEILSGPYFGTSPRYYRYKTVFKNGSYRYSEIKSLAPDGYPNHILSVYPNPTTGPVTVRFSSFRNQKVTLQVVDNMGSVVAQQDMNAVIGPNVISCDISNVIRGIYYVRLINIENRAYKILKQ